MVDLSYFSASSVVVNDVVPPAFLYGLDEFVLVKVGTVKRSFQGYAFKQYSVIASKTDVSFGERVIANLLLFLVIAVIRTESAKYLTHYF